MDIAIDLGKRKSYVAMEDDGKVVKEGYTETSKYGFSTFFGDIKDLKIVVEASSTINRVANIFEGYDIVVANPLKVRLIAQSVRKTNKIDAHVLMGLYKKDYLPKAYLLGREIRDARDICKDRELIVRQRAMIKNKIRYHAYCIGIEFKGFTKKTLKMLKDNPKMSLLIQQLESTDKIIKEYDDRVSVSADGNSYARLINTIPGIAKYGSLCIATQIGDINRFPTEGHLFSYAGLVPRIYQSEDTEWKGRITKSNTFLKTILVECVQIHINNCPDSAITNAYNQIRIRAGKKKARIAAARRLLRVIYWMLKRNETYHVR